LGCVSYTHLRITMACGYSVTFMKDVKRVPNEDAVKDIVNYLKSSGGTILHMGPALAVYDKGVGDPPTLSVVKFEGTRAAVNCYESAEYLALCELVGIGTDILRDVRVMKAPLDLFKEGNAYWVMQVHNILHQQKFNKYYDALLLANETGFDMTCDDGTTVHFTATVAHAGPSSFYEKAVDVVPEKKDAKYFVPGVKTDTGLVVVFEFACGEKSAEIATKFRHSLAYSKIMLKALDTDTGATPVPMGADLSAADETALIAVQKQFADEVFQCDVRVISQ
jgi:uncharacterized protein (DUF1330 family)